MIWIAFGIGFFIGVFLSSVVVILSLLAAAKGAGMPKISDTYEPGEGV